MAQTCLSHHECSSALDDTGVDHHLSRKMSFEPFGVRSNDLYDFEQVVESYRYSGKSDQSDSGEKH